MALAESRPDRQSIDQCHRASLQLLNSPIGSPRESHGHAIAVQDFLAPPDTSPPLSTAARARRQPTIKFNRIESFDESFRGETPENYILNQVENDPNLRMRPRSMSHHLSSTKIPSRLWLRIQAIIWRSLMGFAANVIPKIKAPKRPKPAFVRKVQCSPYGAKSIPLYFYTPPEYSRRRKHGERFPVVVNFHGGGFCLGSATDDCHWARVVVQQVEAVVVSVGYRLAPEHPFPGAVDDGVDALLWLSANADEYGLDMSKTVLSGFSAGANLAFTVPLRLEFFTKKHKQTLSIPSQASNLSRWPSTANLLAESLSTDLKIVSIVAWYPLLDWTTSRSSKRRASRNPKKTLPQLFTDLFDYSYLPPPDIHGYHCSPYASPALAPDFMLNDGLPKDLQLWLCEYDMLLAEGEKFAERLGAIGKNVAETLIPGVPHGFDQSPSPFRDQAHIDGLYNKACDGISEIFKRN